MWMIEKRTEAEEADFQKAMKILKKHNMYVDLMIGSPYTEEEIEEAMDWVDLLENSVK